MALTRAQINRRFRQRHPLGRRDATLARYGLTRSDFDGLVARQGGLCAVCLKPPTGRGLFVDHNHETGEVRGLLCALCNMALGRFGDNESGVRRALEYVSRWEWPEMGRVELLALEAFRAACD